MRKNSFKTASLLIAATLLINSCIGSFSLLNTFAAWNRTATNNKIINGILGLILVPVDGICFAADLFVLNTIEFWTGSNPLAGNIGKTQQVMGKDGRYYAVKTLKDGYEITSPDGDITKFLYNQKEDAWMQVQDGTVKEIFRFNADGTIKVTLPEGETMDVSLDEAGLYQVRMAVGEGNFWAML